MRKRMEPLRVSALRVTILHASFPACRLTTASPSARESPAQRVLMTKPRIDIDIETFTWSNLQADVYRDRHANQMRFYLDSVVTPALDTIDAKHEELLRSDEPAAPFLLNDVEALRELTIQAFTLSVQSQWERQLRGFLKACAREVKCPPDFVKRLESDNWSELLKRFEKLRGLPLQAFDSFPVLDQLQLLGNACRHGEGRSTRMWHERWPEVSLSRSLLERLTHAVIWFWEDLNYIYTNSIERKSSSVDGALAKMREKRARRAQ